MCNLSQSPGVWPMETTNKGKWVRVSSKAQDSACSSGRNHCYPQKVLDCRVYTLESNMAVHTESSKNLKVRLLTYGHIRTIKGRQEVKGMKFLIFPIFYVYMENWGYWRKGKEFLWNMNQLFLTTNHIHSNFSSSVGGKMNMQFYAFHFAYILYLYLECPLSLGLCGLFCVMIVRRIRIFILRTAQTITPITGYWIKKPDSISYCGPIISCSMSSRC